MSSILQEGIYYQEHTTPGKFFCLLFLKANETLDATEIGDCFARLWDMYLNLKKGIVGDLPGHKMLGSSEIPGHGNLTVLVGYGRNIFKENYIKGIKKEIPSDYKNFKFKEPSSAGGGKILDTAGLSYSSDIDKNYATEDIVIQFIADTQLAVNRCILETWKFLFDENKKTNKSSIFLLHSFSGFQREDRRSMLDFHDGLSNMPSGKVESGPGQSPRYPRYDAIRIKEQPIEEDKWTQNGTYLAFLRIAVDLGIWRKIPSSTQEIIIGRDKLSGCPIVDIDSNGNPIPISGCPIEGTIEVIEKGNEKFHNFERTDIKPKLETSHIMRANFNRAENTSDPSTLRIFRQGYEFFEQIKEFPCFRWGLNFVSFQDEPSRLFRMLRQPGWLGNTNFGGNPNSPDASGSVLPIEGMDKLLSVRAAGIYLVPPLDSKEKFPGYSIFF